MKEESKVTTKLNKKQIELVEKANRYTLEVIKFYSLEKYTTSFYFGPNKNAPHLMVLRVGEVAADKFNKTCSDDYNQYPNTSLKDKMRNDMNFLEMYYPLYYSLHVLHSYFISGYQSKDMVKYYSENKEIYNAAIQGINKSLLKIRTSNNENKMPDWYKALTEKEKNLAFTKFTESYGPIG